MRFVERDAKKYLNKEITNDYIDSCNVAKSKLPHLASRSLENLSYYYGISYEGAHRALKDCAINYQVFEYLAHTDISEEEKAWPLCPNCNKHLKLKRSRFGWFWGCPNYPSCNFTQNFTSKKP